MLLKSARQFLFILGLLTVLLVGVTAVVRAQAPSPVTTPMTGVAGLVPGDVVKAEGTALYYYGRDFHKYLFPNEIVYFSWFEDFDAVKSVGRDVVESIPSGNRPVPMRGGSRLVKIQSDPKTYAVEPGGVLRWLTSESIAAYLYGPRWAMRVVDLPQEFFDDYIVGNSLNTLDYPAGSLVSEQVGRPIYYISPTTTRRLIADEQLFARYGFSLLNVVTNFRITTMETGPTVETLENSLYYADHFATTIPCEENWVCTDWNRCDKSRQARVCLDVNQCGTQSKRPAGERACGPNEPKPRDCTEQWECTPWAVCSFEGEQQRVCQDDLRCGGTELQPPLSQSCVPALTCTENWSCGEWTECTDNTRSRTCVDGNTCGTSQAKPPVEQQCDVNVLCQEDWSCAPWTECQGNKQFRSCADNAQCGTTFQKPAEDQVCLTPPSCVEDWQCQSWGACVDGVQARSCTDAQACGSEQYKPLAQRSCSQALEVSPGCQPNWQCVAWSSCQAGHQQRSCVDVNNCSSVTDLPVIDQTCAVDQPAEVISIQDCGVLDQANRTYRLVSDLASPDSCLIIAADGITVDLNGHAIFYNTFTSDHRYGIVVPGQERTPGLFPDVSEGLFRPRSNIAIINGTIIQGQGRGIGSHGIMVSDVTNVRIQKVTIEVNGDDAQNIVVRGGNNIHVANNTIQNGSRNVRQPEEAIAGIHVTEAATVAIHDNRITGGLQYGIRVEADRIGARRIYNNTIQQQALTINPFAIAVLGNDALVYNNTIIPRDGRGILVNGAGHEVFNNYIEVQESGHAPDDDAWTQGIKLKYARDAAIHHNTIVARASDAFGDAYGIDITTRDGRADRNTIYSNVVYALTSSSLRVAAALHVVGVDRDDVDVHHNLLISNSNHLRFSFAPADGMRMHQNVWQLTPGGPDYRPITVDTNAVSEVRNVTVATEVLDPGIDLQKISVREQAAAFSGAWQWQVKVVVHDTSNQPWADQVIQVKDAAGFTAFAGRTDAQGAITGLVTAYELSSPANNPTVEVTKRGPYEVIVGSGDRTQPATIDPQGNEEVVITIPR